MFESLLITHIEKSTVGSSIITFQVPPALKAKYAFIPGQYVILHREEDPQTKRCYSICNTAAEEGIQIGVKRVEGGRLSPYLVDDLQVGDRLSVSRPEGSFRLHTDSLLAQSYVFIAGGSGITPIRSMIDHVLAHEPRSKVILIYGNKQQESIIFRDYFDSISEKQRVKIIHCLDAPSAEWKGEQGLLTVEKITSLVQHHVEVPQRAHFYICGPGAMMDNGVNALSSIGVKKDHVHLEYFTLDAHLEEVETGAALVEIQTEKGRYNVNVNPKESILDAALRIGLDLPYSCKQGVCSSCKQRRKSGELQVLTDLGLTEKEKADDYILLCQSYPKSNDIVIDCSHTNEAIFRRNRRSRRVAVVAGLLCGIILLAGFMIPEQKTYLALGHMNTGHENLACADCHSDSKGNTFQQLNANAKYLFGQRKESVNFGSDDVDNKKCLNCHKRPNDRHPVHRFKEPRFVDARKNLGAENCESCHSEHKDQRIVLANLAYCQECHSDTELSEDPLDVPHTTLIANNEWKTCLQCHDFHGNHVMTTPHLMKDTIPFSAIEAYARGGEDPYSEEKEYVAESEIKAIKKMLDQ